MRGVGFSVAAAVLVLALAAVFSCEKEEVLLPDRNLPPETVVTQAPAESTQTNFRVHMFWYGRDPDGIVTSFRYAIDDTIELGSWKRTSQTDTLFIFTANDPLLRYHEFFIAAIDNEGKADPTPAVKRFFARDDAMPQVWMLDYPNCLVSATGETLACLPPPAEVDTLPMDGDTPILFTWGGTDPDGEIRAFAYKLDTEPYRWVGPETTFAVYPPPSQLPYDDPRGLRTFYIKATDDAAAEMRPSYRYQFVVNFDPDTVIDSLYYIPYNTTDLVPVDFRDDVPDTLPDGCKVEVTWHAGDSDGSVINSLVHLRGPDLLAGQEWSSGWIPYVEDNRWRVPEILRGTLDGPFLMKVFAMDDKERSEGTPDQLQFLVNFPPSVDSLGVGVTDSVIEEGGVPVDTVCVAMFGWSSSDWDNQVNAAIRYYYLLNGRLTLPAEADATRRTWETVLSPGPHTFEVRAYNYRYDARVRYGSRTVSFEISESCGLVSP